MALGWPENSRRAEVDSNEKKRRRNLTVTGFAVQLCAGPCWGDSHGGPAGEGETAHGQGVFEGVLG